MFFFIEQEGRAKDQDAMTLYFRMCLQQANHLRLKKAETDTLSFAVQMRSGWKDIPVSTSGFILNVAK